MWSVLFCQIISKVEFGWQILVKTFGIKFHKKCSVETKSFYVGGQWEDRADSLFSHWFVNPPKNMTEWDLMEGLGRQEDYSEVVYQRKWCGVWTKFICLGMESSGGLLTPWTEQVRWTNQPPSSASQPVLLLSCLFLSSPAVQSTWCYCLGLSWV